MGKTDMFGLMMMIKRFTNISNGSSKLEWIICTHNTPCIVKKTKNAIERAYYILGIPLTFQTLQARIYLLLYLCEHYVWVILNDIKKLG